MKTYKIKSFIYFLVFATAAFFYNKVEQKNDFPEQIKTSEIVDIDNADFEDADLEDEKLLE